MNKYNILFLNKFYYLKGGCERVFFEEISALEKYGHKCIPFSRRSPQDVYSEYAQYFAPPLPLDQSISWLTLKSALEIIYSMAVKDHLKKLLTTIHPDIAHGHNLYGLLTTSVLDVLYSKGIPAVISLHDYKIICPNYKFLHDSRICEDCKTHRYYKAIQNKCVHGSTIYSCIYAFENYFNYITAKFHKKVTKFIAVSRFINEKFVEFGFPAEQIVFIPNFINIDHYEAAFQSEKYFLYFGRLSKEKGIQTLLAAFRHFNRSDYRLIIVGDGPLKKDLEAEVCLFGMDNVRFTGFLSGRALADAVRRSSCVVVPSEWYENCPMTILEAFAYGKPVIGAAIGGIPELIEDKMDGLIFESGNAEDLADKMNYVATLTSLKLEQMGRAGRQKIERHYNEERHYESLIALYQGILH